MPRRYFSDGSEIVFQDFNAIATALEKGLYDNVLFEMLNRTENAFFSDGFKVEMATASSVTIKAGLGFQTDNAQASPEPQKRLLYLATQLTKTIDPAHATNARKDIICVKAQLATELTGSRKYKDAITNLITNQTLVTQQNWAADVVLVTGLADGFNVVPTAPAGYLKIAEITVTPVTGIVNAAAVSDKRTLFPIGGLINLDTTAYTRAPQNATTSITQILAQFDQYLKFGYFNYVDVDDLGSEPASPSASKVRMYYQNGLMTLKTSAGSKVQLGAGGGGGGGANWVPNPGGAPIDDVENNEKVWLFEQGGTQVLTLFVRIPSSYVAGKPIVLYIGAYSPSSGNNWKLQATATLVRKNLDAISSVANQFTSTNSQVTNTVAGQYREIQIDLSTSVGLINGFTPAAGDLVKVDLTRGTATSDDTADVRFIPSATEVKLA